MRPAAFSSWIVSASPEDWKLFVPSLGDGMYWSIGVAGTAKALCGITAPGKTHVLCVQPGVKKASVLVTWYPSSRVRVSARKSPWTGPGRGLGLARVIKSEKSALRLAGEGTAT